MFDVLMYLFKHDIFNEDEMCVEINYLPNDLIDSGFHRQDSYTV